MKKKFRLATLGLTMWASLACAPASTTPAVIAPDEVVADKDDAVSETSATTEAVAAPLVPVVPERESKPGPDWGLLGPSLSATVDKVVQMTDDPWVRRAVKRRGLDLVKVMWEDTGRFHGSAVGPNITDLTLQVRYRRPGAARDSTALMPVIRFPNFTDKTGDVPADRFFVRVGNERGAPLRTVALTDVLRDIRKFASHPESILGSANLLAPRDRHFLVSAQAVFLPIPKTGKAEFNPVVFNYQSAPSSPAVLTLLITRQGTSMTVIENRAEDGSAAGHGQELYFNHHGQRAAFTAERRSAVKKRIDEQGGAKTDDDRTALQKGADVLFLVQVPLKHKARPRMVQEEAWDSAMPMPPAPSAAPLKRSAKSDVERAVLGHGRNRGPFREGRNLKLVRDPRFPIRVTAQFYKATSNGVVSERDLAQIAQTIGGVYEHADFVGSLVVPQDDPKRPTDWERRSTAWIAW
ncbi:MAG: hypothetical protein AAGA56_27580 [Myxococcota bacterium]